MIIGFAKAYDINEAEDIFSDWERADKTLQLKSLQKRVSELKKELNDCGVNLHIDTLGYSKTINKQLLLDKKIVP